MSRKLLASVASVLVGTASFMAAGSTSAYALGAGCTADNASTTTTITGSITYPPGSVSVDSTSIHCQYVSNGGQVTWRCDLYAGDCSITFGTAKFGCIVVKAYCTGNFFVAPGTVIDVTVHGGSASAHDIV